MTDILSVIERDKFLNDKIEILNQKLNQLEQVNLIFDYAFISAEWLQGNAKFQKVFKNSMKFYILIKRCVFL